MYGIAVVHLRLLLDIQTDKYSRSRDRGSDIDALTSGDMDLRVDREEKIQAFETKWLENFSVFPTWSKRAEYQRLGAEQDQRLCGPTGIPSGNCREMETRVVQACHVSRQPF